MHCEPKWLLCKPSDLLDETDSEDEDIPEKYRQLLAKNHVKPLTHVVKDPWDNLPESLEYLYLDGLYILDEWDDLVEMFKTINPRTPKLTLENFCLNRNGDTTWGGAAEPDIKFANPPLEDIWNGHNCFL